MAVKRSRAVLALRRDHPGSLAAAVDHVHLRPLLHQVRRDERPAHVDPAMQRRLAIVVDRVHVETELQAVLDRLECTALQGLVVGGIGTEAVLVLPLDIVGAGRDHQRGRVVDGGQERIGAAFLHEHPHDLDVAETGGEQERGRTLRLRRQAIRLRDAARDERQPLLQAGIRIGARRQQGARHVRHLPLDRGVERRASRAGVVRVGAAFDQEQRHLRVAAVDGDQQGRGVRILAEQHAGIGVAANPVRRRFVDAGAGGEQQARHADVPLLRREQQRREAVRRSGRRAAARLEQHARRLRMVLGDRPHQRRLAAQRFRGGRVGARRQQAAHHVDVTDPRRRQQRGNPAHAREIRVRPRLEQQLHHWKTRVERGEGKRRDPMVVRRVHLRAGIQQQPGGLGMIPVGRPVQGGRAVSLRQVDVRSARDKAFGAGQIAQLDGLDQRRFGRRGRGGNRGGKPREEERHGSEQQDTVTPIAHGLASLIRSRGSRPADPPACLTSPEHAMIMHGTQPFTRLFRARQGYSCTSRGSGGHRSDSQEPWASPPPC